MLMFWYNFINK